MNENVLSEAEGDTQAKCETGVTSSYAKLDHRVYDVEKILACL